MTLVPTAAPLQLSNGRTLGLAVGGGYVWATAADAGDLLRVDPATLAIERVHVGGSPIGIAVAGGSVWVAERDRGEVVRRDLQTLRPVGRPIHVGDRSGVAGGRRHFLFVGDAASGTVTRIDMRSGETTGPPIRVAEPANDAPALGIAPSGTSVWVSSFGSNTLTRVSATPSARPFRQSPRRAPRARRLRRALPRAGKVVAQHRRSRRAAARSRPARALSGR